VPEMGYRSFAEAINPELHEWLLQLNQTAPTQRRVTTKQSRGNLLDLL